MIAEAIQIPYESQTDTQTNRDCGAACLSMVYRSFGKEVSREELWLAIAELNRFGSVSSTTHLMVREALTRGFAAVAVQARYPLQALRVCRDAGIRAILNHRFSPESPAGHYTVLVDIDENSVVVHDPFFGPSRRLSHAELLELWQPFFSNSEIAGDMLIGIAAEPQPVAVCAFCHTPLPEAVECPKCRKLVGQQPDALMGCITSTCIGRMWNYLCCPSCDYTWTFSVAQTSTAEAAGKSTPAPRAPNEPTSAPQAGKTPPQSVEELWNLGRLFGELDKFCNHIQTLPGATSHPEIAQQLAYISASKEKLKLAQAEELAHRRVTAEQIGKLQAAAKQASKAHAQKMEELNHPSPSLDPHALGRALLRNLGYDE